MRADQFFFSSSLKVSKFVSYCNKEFVPLKNRRKKRLVQNVVQYLKKIRLDIGKACIKDKVGLQLVGHLRDVLVAVHGFSDIHCLLT